MASLWRVHDRATQVLMVQFYENLWGKKLGKLEALRQAQLAMLRGELASEIEAASRALGPPERLKQKYDYSHPRFWAGFVLSGDWR